MPYLRKCNGVKFKGVCHEDWLPCAKGETRARRLMSRLGVEEGVCYKRKANKRSKVSAWNMHQRTFADAFLAQHNRKPTIAEVQQSYVKSMPVTVPVARLQTPVSNYVPAQILGQTLPVTLARPLPRPPPTRPRPLLAHPVSKRPAANTALALQFAKKRAANRVVQARLSQPQIRRVQAAITQVLPDITEPQLRTIIEELD